MAIFKNKRVTGFARATVGVACAVGLALPFAAGAESLSEQVERLSNSIDGLEENVRSTLLSGGSTPISFSGEARIKTQYHNLGFDAPGYMQPDRSYIQSGWEGNENLFRLGMIVRPGRNTVLWAKLGFQHTLMGNRSYHDYTGAPGYDEGYTPYPYRHDKAHNSVTIHEDMSAGIAIRTAPASFWVRMGNTMWTEASPLTVWKAQPRTFAWEYLPFEVEQPIARYYEYNIAKGEKSGRAAWNKKPFNGINVESIKLPYELYANFVYGTFERFDNFEREYIDFAGDLGYADGAFHPFPEKGHGIGDSYRHVIHGRLAKKGLAKDGWLGDMTLGLNYVGINYSDDVLYAAKREPNNTFTYPLLREFRGYDSVFVKEPKTFSVDLRGPIGKNFTLHADVAINRTDTTWFIDTAATHPTIHMNPYFARATRPWLYTERAVTGTDKYVPAFYAKLGYTDVLPMELDLAWIHPGFYSPFSFATPMDAFYAFGSNMVGAGKFIARGEGSPYTQNMAGANLTLNPKLEGYGHLRFKYGQHFNITEGRDLLFFPYRLNGSDMFSFFHSSFNRWGNSLIDNSVKAGGRSYKARLGDESFVHASSYNTNINLQQVAGPGAGGLRSDYLSMFEGFVPYRDSMEAFLNFRAKHMDLTYSGTNNPTRNVNLSSIMHHSLFDNPIRDDETGDTIGWRDSTNTSWVPTSQKYTFNLEVDAAYDIGRFVGYKRDLFVGGYAGLSGVSRGSPSVISFNEGKVDDDNLLWSFYMRLEPAIALRKNFYLLGLLGYENWRSNKSWAMVRRGAAYNNPNDENDPDNGKRFVTGVGFTSTTNPNPSIVTTSTPTLDDFVRVPIDYRDWAIGVGFDWDVLERVGLHARVKWIGHEDRGLNKMYDKWVEEGKGKGPIVDGVRTDAFTPTALDRNDWVTPVFSLELKTWF